MVGVLLVGSADLARRCSSLEVMIYYDDSMIYSSLIELVISSPLHYGLLKNVPLRLGAFTTTQSGSRQYGNHLSISQSHTLQTRTTYKNYAILFEHKTANLAQDQFTSTHNSDTQTGRMFWGTLAVGKSPTCTQCIAMSVLGRTTKSWTTAESIEYIMWICFCALREQH